MRTLVAGSLALLTLALSSCSGCAAPAAGAPSATVATDPPTSHAPAAMPTASDLVLVGAGDIASCTNDDDEKTARLVERVLAAAAPGSRAFTAGDNVYPGGEKESFRACYLPTWGRFLRDTLPVPGNHDWKTPGAAGYFATFGPSAGTAEKPWRSVDVGAWHVVLLDSDCDEVGGCDEGSAQHEWLKADLRASTAACTIAVWHHPLASSGPHGSDPRTRALWQALDDARAELVISGHDHIYERLAPLRADGSPAPPHEGLRSFVIGTGGASSYPLRAFPAAGSEVQRSGEPAVLVLFLDREGYRWRAITADGRALDEGQARCR